MTATLEQTQTDLLKLLGTAPARRRPAASWDACSISKGARRRQRIAKGSDVSVTELNTMLNRFAQMRQMMKKMGKFQKMMSRMGGGAASLLRRG